MENKDEKILQCIQEYTGKMGYPPTIREIADMVGLKSTSSVASHISKLRERGLVAGGNYPRTLTLVTEKTRKP